MSKSSVSSVKKQFALLTMGASNPKTHKSEIKEHYTFILHLAPYKLAGVGNMCAHATPECIVACLNTAGHGGIFREGETTNAVQEARIRRTRLFKTDRQTFLALLVRDIEKGIRYAEKRGFTPVFRLNGTSDIPWERVPVKRRGIKYANIFCAFPTEQFYDYTKFPYAKRAHDIPNYDLTFSLAETIKNRLDAETWLNAGHNAAAVFRVKNPEYFPGSYQRRTVINGDAHDLRFQDPKGGNIVALKAKGRARTLASTGFVIDVED